METIKTVFSEANGFLLTLKINVMYVLLWVAAGYVQSQYFKWFTKFSDAWKTLVLGSVFSVVYAILLRDVTTKATWVEFFASYIFATSFYELLLKDSVSKVVAYAKKLFEKKFES